jgi:hypothetical protein
MSVTREGSGRTALITGASAGIGMALAQIFAAKGFDLVLTARRADRLQALAGELQHIHGIAARAMPADLAQPETPADLLAALAQAGIAVDVLVNNAVQRDFLQVLVTAPCELAHRLLPAMTRRGYGRILNVASVAGMMPGSASHTLYGAAKALMIKFSQSLHSEQSETGVFVSALCPGFTYSEFHDVNGTRAAMNRLPKFLWLSADRVAADGYRALMRNQPICIPGMQYKLISAMVRLLPMGVAYRLGQQRSRLVEKSARV